MYNVKEIISEMVFLFIQSKIANSWATIEEDMLPPPHKIWLVNTTAHVHLLHGITLDHVLEMHIIILLHLSKMCYW